MRLDGLSVDTDLRWALLARLVSRGGGRTTPVFGLDEIDAELARDATDAGETARRDLLRRDPHGRGQAGGLAGADRR